MTAVHDPNESELFVYTDDKVDRYLPSEWSEFDYNNDFLIIKLTIGAATYKVAIYPMRTIKKIVRV